LITRPLAIAALCAVALIAACGVDQAPSDSRHPDAVFSSSTTKLIGFRLDDQRHGSHVYALGLDGPVCLSVTPEVEDSLLHSTDDALRFFEADGRISARGRFGNMGMCRYVFAVSRLIQDRMPTDAERALFGQIGNNAVRALPGELSGPARDPIVER
jgi:hypothetical protein